MPNLFIITLFQGILGTGQCADGVTGKEWDGRWTGWDEDKTNGNSMDRDECCEDGIMMKLGPEESQRWIGRDRSGISADETPL